MTDVTLGNNLHVAGWLLRGCVPPDKLADVLTGAVEQMGMTTNNMAPVIRQYPLPNGKGGVGHTVFQPLVESYIVADDYPALGKTYVVAASCKPFAVNAVGRYLAHNIGPLQDLKGFVL